MPVSPTLLVYLIVISYYTVRASAAVLASAVLAQHALQKSHLLPRAMSGSSIAADRTVFTTFSLLAIFLIGITIGKCLNCANHSSTDCRQVVDSASFPASLSVI